MMHDLTNIQKTFNELIMSRLDDKILERNNIGENEELIREELFEMKEIIEVPFGSIIYSLGLEDEKPVLYVEIASRMGSDDLYVIIWKIWKELKIDLEKLKNKYLKET